MRSVSVWLGRGVSFSGMSMDLRGRVSDKRAAESGQSRDLKTGALMTKLCHHVKENGISCHSPAVRGEGYCHFHLRYKGHRLRTWRNRRAEPWHLKLPVLDNMDAVRASIKQVKEAMSTNRMDGKTARLMLYGLRLAAANVRAIESAERHQLSASESIVCCKPIGMNSVRENSSQLHGSKDSVGGEGKRPNKVIPFPTGGGTG